MVSHIAIFIANLFQMKHLFIQRIPILHGITSINYGDYLSLIPEGFSANKPEPELTYTDTYIIAVWQCTKKSTSNNPGQGIIAIGKTRNNRY
jgi:hypothetical protein